MQIGRVCVKLAGRDAGKRCVIVNVYDANFVMIDGETRRRRCNVRHLEPLSEVVDISQDASSAEVAKALGINLVTKTQKQKSEKPTTKRSKTKKSPTPMPEAKVKPMKEKKIKTTTK